MTVADAIAGGIVPDANPRKPKDARLANMGDAWERVICAQHDRYRQLDVADIDKTPAPAMVLSGMRQERNRPVFTACWGVSTMPDYVGVLAIGSKPGRCVRLEAKSAKEDRVTLLQAVSPTTGKPAGGGLKAVQVASLGRASAMGAFAAVLVIIPAGMWIVPFPMWRAPADEPTRKSLSPKHLDAQGVRFGSANEAERVILGLNAPADWLGAAMRKGWL